MDDDVRRPVRQAEVIPMRRIMLAVIVATDLASHSAGPWGIKLADRDPSVRAADDLYLSQIRSAR
jgi:hypothetical protein